MTDETRLGATHLEEGRTRFAVWAPDARRVEVVLYGRREPLKPGDRGLHAGDVENVPPGTRYRLSLDGGEPLPDPASRFQPDGVHGPSAVTDLAGFPWTDREWRGLPLDRHVIYELHVGTFTPDGTFDAVIERLDDLRDLGVTAIEIMPVAQFPGERNWGYDGVFPFAAQDSYGGPEELARLVDAAHAREMAVVLDVVYNHLGPEGNVLPDFGPYFTDRYATPWGDALNFDGPGSDGVRRYFLENALWWLLDLHVDALRLDAIHGIVDTTARPFLAELSEAVDRAAERTGRSLHLIAETDQNDPRIVAPRDRHGLGIHAMWADDFHHAIHSLLTEERDGYYEDFGGAEQLAEAMRHGFWFTGRYSRHRGRRHGAPMDEVSPTQLVVYVQNHDQVGNRPRGRRLGRLLDFEQRKLASGLVLLSPFVPLLFMGEEYAEPSPFQYFVSHTDPDLVEAVRQGRREEFSHFEWREEPPDPQDEGTFLASRLDWDLREKGQHGALLDLHHELLRLRREHPALSGRASEDHEVALEGSVLTLTRRSPDRRHEAVALFNLSAAPAPGLVPGDGWERLVDSADPRWEGPGGPGPDTIAPHAFVLVAR